MPRIAEAQARLMADTPSAPGLVPRRKWPARLYRAPGAPRAQISHMVTLAPGATSVSAAGHALLGSPDGGAGSVEIEAGGTAGRRGPTAARAAGFFLGGRRMRSRRPGMRLTCVKLAAEPHATGESLRRKILGAARQSRSSAEDPSSWRPPEL